MLVKQLVLQKKKNGLIKEEIKQHKRQLKQQEKAREEQQVDLDNIDQAEKLFGQDKSPNKQTAFGA